MSSSIDFIQNFQTLSLEVLLTGIISGIALVPVGLIYSKTNSCPIMTGLSFMIPAIMGSGLLGVFAFLYLVAYGGHTILTWAIDPRVTLIACEVLVCCSVLLSSITVCTYVMNWLDAIMVPKPVPETTPEPTPAASDDDDDEVSDVSDVSDVSEDEEEDSDDEEEKVVPAPSESPSNWKASINLEPLRNAPPLPETD
jgi:hypothetical protein